MSYTTVIAIWPGDKIAPLRQLKNSWGSAPYIWRQMSRRYLGLELLTHSDGERERLLGLWKDPAIPKAHRAVLVLTLERAYVVKKDFLQMARDIEQFLMDFPEDPKLVNHWPTIAFLLRVAAILDGIKTLEGFTDIPAVGLHRTSVSPNPFLGPWNDERQEHAPLDWTSAFDLYQQLDSLCASESAT